MRHHQHHNSCEFVIEPIEFDKNTEKPVLQYCLGATLYMPGTKQILPKILDRQLEDLTSMVMCFEDAIAADDLPTAETNVLEHLTALSNAVEQGQINIADIPLIFLRVRDIDQFIAFSNRLTPSQASALTGFVFPKFYSENALLYLQQLDQLNQNFNLPLYGMPILEGSAIAFRETRDTELVTLKTILDPFKQLILNIRVGGTDFSSLFGVRRGINSSIYDILTVRDCLSNILNFFSRAGDGYTVSAPVWEYFLAYKKDNIEDLLSQNIHHSILNRKPIINEAIDGLLREVLMDKANGFVGKTVIHPSHLKYVNAMQCVTQEEYEDAQQILNTSGGVIKSTKANKMNEINPHRSWANRVNRRAKAYGVIPDESYYLKLIQDPTQ